MVRDEEMAGEELAGGFLDNIDRFSQAVRRHARHVSYLPITVLPCPMKSGS